MLGKHVIKYVPTYIKGTKKKKKKKKKNAKDLLNNTNAMFFVCFFFLLIFFIKVYAVDKSMQFKWVPTTYAFLKT